MRAPSETPISRADFIAVNVRAEMVSRLWQQCLTAEAEEISEGVLEKVREFYRDETILQSEWQALRNKEMKEQLRRASIHNGVRACCTRQNQKSS